MANAYTIKETPESTDSVTISDVTGAIFRATLGSLPGTSSAVGGYVDPPVYSDSEGTKGQYSFDAGHIYMCIADNAWDRFPVTWDAWGTAMPENPVVLSSVIDVSGATLTINFDRNVFQGSAYLDSDFNLDASIGGSDIGITYQSGDGTRTRIYSILTVIREGETVDLDYNGRANGLEDANGNDLLSISSMSVTNLSEDLYSDIILWDGFEGIITGTTYEATNYDYPAFHTAQTGLLISLSTTTKKVGSKSLRISGATVPFKYDIALSEIRGRVGFWCFMDDCGYNQGIISLSAPAEPNANRLALYGYSPTELGVYLIVSGVSVINAHAEVPVVPDTWAFIEMIWDFTAFGLKLCINGDVGGTAVFPGTHNGVIDYTAMSLGQESGVWVPGIWGNFDNLIVSTDPNRDLYALALLEAYPG